MDQQMPAPGWYPDPTSPGQRRYWDGRGWTNNTAPGAVPPSRTQPLPFVPPGAGYGTAPQPRNASAGQPSRTSDAYYQRADAQFDAGGSTVVWNWAAFLFGAFWYFYRGMWPKALLFAAIVIFTGGFLALPVWIYGGLRGTYDDYLLRRRGTQGW